jgi:hypothetical protein
MKRILIGSILVCSGAFGFDQNIFDVCKGNDEPSSLMGLYRKVPIEAWSKTPEEIAEDFSSYYSPTHYDVWIFEGQPIFRIRKAGYLLQESVASEYLKSWKIETPVYQTLEGLESSPLAYPASSKKFTEDSINKYFNGQNEFEEMVGKSASLICLKYSSSGCAKAVKAATAMMNSHIAGNSYVSTPELIRKLFTEEIYAKAMIPVAKIVWKRAHALTGEYQTTHSDFSTILDLLLMEFKKLGLSDEEAFDRTMDIMGLYATRGASVQVLSYFVNDGNYQAFFAMEIISAGISLLEFERPKTENNFGLPRGIKSSCLYGNIYHFWMSAYLSYELKKQGFKVKTAFSAAHILSAGYQMFVYTINRSPIAFLNAETNSPMKQQMRTTVIIDDAGALWGLKGNTKEWDLDFRHNWMLRNYKVHDFSKLSDDEKYKIVDNKIRYYLLWTSEIRHNSLFTQISGAEKQRILNIESIDNENPNSLDFRF